MTGMELPFWCPEFRSGSLKSPCEGNLARIKELLEKGQTYLGVLEKCQECQGRKLEVRTVKESQMAKEHKVEKGFCPDHPEEEYVILGPGRRPVGGKIPGKCRSCVQGVKPYPKPENIPASSDPAPPAAPPPNRPIPRLCDCGVEPEKIDSLHRPMGVCGK